MNPYTILTRRCTTSTITPACNRETNQRARLAKLHYHMYGARTTHDCTFCAPPFARSLRFQRPASAHRPTYLCSGYRQRSTRKVKRRARRKKSRSQHPRVPAHIPWTNRGVRSLQAIPPALPLREHVAPIRPLMQLHTIPLRGVAGERPIPRVCTRRSLTARRR